MCKPFFEMMSRIGIGDLGSHVRRDSRDITRSRALTTQTVTVVIAIGRRGAPGESEPRLVVSKIGFPAPEGASVWE